MGILELKEVSKIYKKNLAVDNLSIEINKGEVFGLIGSNGAGKSTTISMIATLIRPDKGEIFFDGQNIVKNPKAIREKLGYVPQDIALYPMLSGFDNLKFWGKSYHLKKNELFRRMEEVIGIIGLNVEQLNSKVSTYSGGMKRRLNIGVALLHHPEIVIMDEPTVGIDVVSRNQILYAIRCLRKAGTTVIYVGHYMEELEQICDRICIMDKGKAVIIGDIQRLLENRGEKISLENLYLKTIK